MAYLPRGSAILPHAAAPSFPVAHAAPRIASSLEEGAGKPARENVMRFMHGLS
jgi:hypothetical protein